MVSGCRTRVTTELHAERTLARSLRAQDGASSLCCCPGPGSLAPNMRQAISEGVYGSTPLGAFAQKVAEHAFTVNDDDIRELHRANIPTIKSLKLLYAQLSAPVYTGCNE